MKQINSLTGLRFFAAFAIVINHLGPVIFKIDNRVPLLNFFHQLALLGMSLFFILSGFIIHYNYHNKVSASLKGVYNFFVARLARIYPLFFIVLLYDLASGNFLLYGNAVERNQLYHAIPYFITLTQSWFYFFIGNHPIAFPFELTHVAWSISTEFFFYLCYPMICFFIIKIRSIKARIGIMIFAFIAVILLFSLGRMHTDFVSYFGNTALGIVENPNANPGVIFSGWLFYTSPYSRIFEFLLGCSLAHLYLGIANAKASKKETIVSTSLLVLSILNILLLLYPRITIIPNLIKILNIIGFAPSLAIIIFYCARYENIISRFMSNKLFMKLGDASYSMYLLHIIIIQKSAVPYPIPGTTENIILLCLRAFIIIAIVLIVSVGSYNVFEVPTRRFVRNILSIKDKKIMITK